MDGSVTSLFVSTAHACSLVEEIMNNVLSQFTIGGRLAIGMGNIPYIGRPCQD